MRTVRVAILEDHAVVVDGYRYRLGQTPDITIAFAAVHGAGFEEQLALHQPIDVALMDLSVPTAADNRNPYAIPAAVPRLQQQYPNLNVIIVSVTAEPVLIDTLLDAGVTGYLVKSDAEAHERLSEIISIVADGGQYLSHTANQLLRRGPNGGEAPLTKRQLQVLALCAAYPDSTSGELAQQLSVSPTTVRNLMSQVYLRLEVRTRHAAVLRAKALGLI